MPMRLPPLYTLFNRTLYLLSAVFLIASFFLPVHGVGPSLCPFELSLRRPCFGCGMTRALSSISQGEWELAWRYHPFSFLLWPLIAVCALAAIPPLGRRVSTLLRGPRGPILTRIFWSVAALYLAYGLIRIFAWPDWPS